MPNSICSARPWVSFASADNPDSRRGYGFQRWIMDDGSGNAPMQYGGSGYGGQSLIIAPELDLVAVVNSWNIYEKSYSAQSVIMDHVIPAAH